MNFYRNAEIDYRERCKARIQRQLGISESPAFLFLPGYCVVLKSPRVLSMSLSLSLLFLPST